MSSDRNGGACVASQNGPGKDGSGTRPALPDTDEIIMANALDLRGHQMDIKFLQPLGGLRGHGRQDARPMAHGPAVAQPRKVPDRTPATPTSINDMAFSFYFGLLST